MEKKAGRLYGREFMSHEENRRIKQQYDRIAARYDLVDRLIPRSWRVKATQLAYGRVLEAGVGTGLNLPYYTDRCQEIVGIDLSLPMLEQAAQRVHQCKVPVVLAEMDIQALDLASASFDCVLVSFVFCTVADPLQGLRECLRVLRPGGRMILLEHMASDRPWLRGAMNRLNPITVRLLGDNINRQTSRSVELAGLHAESSENLFGDVVRLIVASRWIADS